MDEILDDPVPLGLVAFATAAFVSGTILAGWWPVGRVDMAFVGPLVFLFGGVAQFVAAMWCYARHQAVAATFFGIFGSFFAAVAFYAMEAPAVIRLVTDAILGPWGVGVACLAFVAFFLAVALSRHNPGFAVTSLVLGIALFFVAWSLFARGNAVLGAIGGWVMLISGLFGFLTAASLSVAEGRRMLVSRMPSPAGGRGPAGAGRTQAT
jgi:succinate-acetate transporter protein